MDRVFRSPRQASAVFSLGGKSPPRQKHLFIVNFRRAGGGAGSLWQKDLPFLVRLVERPNVDVRIEELHQYNKKRLVQTGFKITPVRIEFYDTADSMAKRMWAEYARFHFGDFRHAENLSDFKYDVMTDEFMDSGGGFGYAPITSSGVGATENEFNSHFFFETIQIYEVFGNQYVQTDLINPRIMSFVSSDLDYSSAEVSTVGVTLACEAIIYANDSIPQPLMANEFLLSAFQDVTKFNGDVIDVTSGAVVANISNGTGTEMAVAQTVQWTNPQVTTPELRTYSSSSSSSGALASYGSYNFGSLVSGSHASQSTASDLSLAALSNPALASALRLSRTRQAAAEATSTVLSGSPSTPSAISQGTYDIARSAVSSIGSNYGRIDSQYMQDAVVFGVISAAEATSSSPREHVFNRSPGDAGSPPAVQTRQPARFRVKHPEGTAPLVADGGSDRVQNAWSSTDGQGITLTRETYGILNAQRSPASQIGVNENVKGTKTISLNPKHLGKPKNS